MWFVEALEPNHHFWMDSELTLSESLSDRDYMSRADKMVNKRLWGLITEENNWSAAQKKESNR